MAQYEVYEVIKQTPRTWLMTADIAKKLRSNPSLVSNSLKKLRRLQFIYRKFGKNEKGKTVPYFKIVPKGKYVKFHFPDADDVLSSVNGHQYYI